MSPSPKNRLLKGLIKLADILHYLSLQLIMAGIRVVTKPECQVRLTSKPSALCRCAGFGWDTILFLHHSQEKAECAGNSVIWAVLVIAE